MRHLRPTKLIVALLLLPTWAQADPPKVSSFFPGGGRLGESVRVEAKGTFKPWPVQIQVDRPGICFTPEEEEGVFTVSIADDAAPGLAWVRLFNEEGAATLRPFQIGTVSEVVEVEPNNADHQAQEVDPQGVVVNGRLERSGDVDSFAVTLESGQTLVVALEANNRLGSPMDGKIQVVSPEGFVVDHADDSPLLDPSLAFTAPTSGTYVVRAFAFPAQPDSSIRFSGSDDYVYRLTLTTGGYVDLAHPSVVNLEPETEVAAAGWNVPGEGVRLRVSPGPERSVVAWNPDLAGAVEVEAAELPVVLASALSEQPASLPALICGQLGEDGEADRFPIKAEPGTSIMLRMEARAFGSPLDGVITVEDSSGKQLVEMDDLRRELDPELTVKVPDDGMLQVQVRDLHRRGGSRFLYRVEAREPSPVVRLTVSADHFELDREKPLSIEVEVDRQGGYKNPLTITAEGLPDGVTVEPVVSESEGDSSKKVTLQITATEAAAVWSGPIRILGTAEGAEDSAASATAERVGGSRTESLWLTVPPSS
ncbi:PPC domain-containing protein [Tautonia marina]|uniref:PPC domain-containing protein n=1 Tax=Tautonia marina TaxID=2653855 RepID=UPI0012605F74|nr:PPC domain-containing protein [Tautonia marina]